MKGDGEHPPQCSILVVAKDVEADNHTFMSSGGLILISFEHPVPPGRVETEIAVHLHGISRAVNAVQVRRDHEQPERSVDATWDADVGMVEHGHAVQRDLEEQDSQRRRAEQKDHGELVGR